MVEGASHEANPWDWSWRWRSNSCCGLGHAERFDGGAQRRDDLALGIGVDPQPADPIAPAGLVLDADAPRDVGHADGDRHDPARLFVVRVERLSHVDLGFSERTGDRLQVLRMP